MTITLKPEVQRMIDEKVRAGHYPSADSLVESAVLNLLQDEADEIEELRRELEPALEQAKRGQFVQFTAEDIIAQGRAELERRQQAKKAV